MYRYESAVLRKKGQNTPYETVDLTNVKMADLFNLYQDGYIELSEPSLAKHIYAKLEDLRLMELPFSNVTFQSWLGTIGNKTIVGTTTKPTIQENTISFSDAIQAGFDVRRVSWRNVGHPENFPESELRDAYIYKSTPFYDIVQKRTLTVVNGLLHLNIPYDQGLLIKEAGRSLEIEQDNHIGVISFENIGDVQQIPIKDEMLSNLPENTVTTLREGVYIDLGVDLTDKTVMLSFCGRLFTTHDIIQRVNNSGAVRVDLYKLDLVQIILESRTKIDLSSLELDERMYRQGAIRYNQILDNDVVKAMLKLMQSFFIIIDTPRMLKQLVTLNRVKLPGIFEYERPTTLPFINSKGLMLPYWKITHDNAYTTLRRLHVKDNFYRSPVLRTSEVLNIGSKLDWVNNIDEITHVDYEVGHLLCLKTQLLQYT